MPEEELSEGHNTPRPLKGKGKSKGKGKGKGKEKEKEKTLGSQWLTKKAWVEDEMEDHLDSMPLQYIKHISTLTFCSTHLFYADIIFS